jgi:hypothetical protein
MITFDDIFTFLLATTSRQQRIFIWDLFGLAWKSYIRPGAFMLQALNVFLVDRTGVMRRQGSFTWVYVKSQFEAGFGN